MSHQTDTPSQETYFISNVANFKDVLIYRHIKRIYFQTSAIQIVWLSAPTAHCCTCGKSRVNPLDCVVHYCRL